MKKQAVLILFVLIGALGMVNAQNSVISGNINTIYGDALTDGEVRLLDAQGNLVASQAITNGQYNFIGLTDNVDYTLQVERNTHPLNGVSTFDIVLIAKHILGLQPISSSETMIAADVNLTNSITTLDLLLIRRMILFIDPAFPELPSWRFIPADLVFNNPSNPFPDLTSNSNSFTITTNGANVVFDVTGIKLGDVNGSVFP